MSKLAFVSLSYRWERRLREVKWLAQNYIARSEESGFKPKLVLCQSLYILYNSAFPKGLSPNSLVWHRTLLLKYCCSLLPVFVFLLQLVPTHIIPSMLSFSHVFRGPSIYPPLKLKSNLPDEFPNLLWSFHHFSFFVFGVEFSLSSNFVIISSIFLKDFIDF